MPGKLAQRLARIGRVLARAAIALAFVAVAVPVAQCLVLRVHDPWFTWTMVEVVVDHYRATGRLERPAYHPVDLDDLPACVPVAAITSEDQRFFEHDGFDFDAIEKAWRSNRHGKRLVGGSTISQQVARNAFLWQGRTWLRKGLEAWYTIWLELLVPKERILEVYVNVAEMGPMTFGIEAASERWYHKPATKLTPYEAATIISLLPLPRTWTPGHKRVQRHAAWIVDNPIEPPELLAHRSKG